MPVSTHTSTVCPRCEAPIRGNFRYCPECAYRLRPGPRQVTEPAPSAAQRLSLSLLLTLGALLGVGAFLAGRELFRDPDGGPQVSVQVLTVADIPQHLVYMPPAAAVYDFSELRWEPVADAEAWRQVTEAVEYDAGRAFAAEALARPALLLGADRLLARWVLAVEEVLEDTGRPYPRPVRTRPFHLLAHEVSRSQYAEFLTDVLANPEWIRRLEASQDLAMLWRPQDTDESPHQTYHSESYIRFWWQAVQAHAREAALRRWREGDPLPEEQPLPDWLAHTPLAPEAAARLLIPPHWVTATGPDPAFAWEMVGDPNWPVTEVSWFDAEAFALWASRRLGISLRVPTDLEWRRAFHRGNPYRSQEEPGWRYPWGRERRDWACNNLNYWQRYMNQEVPQLLPVLTLFPGDEAFRREGLLYSMAGNAAEWLRNSYYGSTGDGPLLPDGAEVTRDGLYLHLALRGGGSYRLGISDCALEAMASRPKGERAIDAGFRLLVRDL